MANWRFLALILLLTGCATPAERAERQQREMDEMMAVYGPACEKLGYVRNEDKWRDCILELNEKDERRAGRASFSTCIGGRGLFGCGGF